MSLFRVGRAEPVGSLAAPLPAEAQTQCAGLAHTLRRPSQAVRVLALVSSGAGEGTSTSVVNVARYLAGVGAARTLVIDANVYAPALHTLAGVASSPGLAEVLHGDVPFDDAVRSTVVPNLSVLTAGDLGLYLPGVMLSIEALRTQVLSRTDGYEFVLVDCPPVNVYEDAAMVGGLCDGVILVTEGGRTRRHAALAAKRRLEQAECRVLGVFMNKRKFYIPSLFYERL